MKIEERSMNNDEKKTQTALSMIVKSTDLSI